MLDRELRKEMMDAMVKLERASDKLGDLIENFKNESGMDIETLQLKSEAAGLLAEMYSGLKQINGVLLTDALLGMEQRMKSQR